MSAKGGTLLAAGEREIVTADPAPDVSLMFERLAKDPAVDVEKLERLIAMQERIMRHQAKAAFDGAFAEMMGEIPAIIERAKTNNGKYAPLEDIIAKVRPILQKHHFSLSHRTEWPDAKMVRIIGVLTHKDGHERTSEFLSAADASGNKNAIQGLGSAIAYGRRYTTKDLLNIVTRGEDTDGKGVGEAEPPDAPAGFEDWWDDMQAKADEGLRAVKIAFNESRPEYRTHLTKTAAQAWEMLKAKAAAKGRS